MTTENTYVTVRGHFKRRLWGNAEQFRISLYELEDAEGTLPTSVESENTFVAKGAFLPENTFVIVRFTGRWEKNKNRDGYCFKVKTFQEEPPVSKKGIVKFLASGMYRGIGEKTAENIFQTFGKNSIEIVTRKTERLREVKGIGAATVSSIIESVKKTVELQDLVLFLAQYDVSLSKIKRIQKAFPDDTLEVIQSEPFKLCDVRGFGFSTVDAIAAKLGTPLGSPLRVQAAICTILSSNNGEGHLYINESDLLSKVSTLLNSRATVGDEVHEDAIKAELQIMEFDNKIVVGNDTEGVCIVHREPDFNDERNTAQRLVNILRKPLDLRKTFRESELDTKIKEAEKQFKIELAPKQVEAVKTALTNKVCIITGGPGTGKTTILRILLRLYKENVAYGYVNEETPGVLLLSPTGKAARRMSESAQEPAYTIHKGLGIRPGDEITATFEGSESLLTEDVGIVFVDECSMTDMNIMAKLVAQLPIDAQLVCIGDIDQLPSVGAGAVLKDMIGSSIIPVVRLDVIYRQGETSLIVKNAHKIKVGDTKLETSMAQFPFFPTPFSKQPRSKSVSENVNVDANGDIMAQEQMIDFYLRAVNKYSIKEAQILCPRRDTVTASAMEVNNRVQERLFGNRKDVQKFVTNGTTFHVGERIIQTKNTDSSNNGDMGTIKSIRPDPEQAGSFIASIAFDFMDEGETTDYYMGDFDNVQLGYAITVHRSQGSEYKAVFIPMLWSQVHMLRRNLLYTGVTRGKEIACLFGQSEAIRAAIRTEDVNTRNTMFMHRLRESYYGKGNAA